MTDRRVGNDQAGFTLIELVVVIGIMILVAAFIGPAVTFLKSAGDVTSTAYTVKGGSAGVFKGSSDILSW